MPNTRSAAKRMRVIARRTLRNRMIKSRMKTFIRKYEAALAQGDLALSAELLRKATSEIDRAAAKGVIHRNAASRRKSRLAAKFNALMKAVNG
ncbi:MAG: 30S ribosomal protein S20 [Limnochordales bacterium]|jgi:ribosomal protein S20|nr:30S ribosomal protein S20 [Bacillota bacterium]